MNDTPTVDREALAAVLIQHQRMDIGRCLCGWGQEPRHLGLSHADHKVDAILASGVLHDASELIAQSADAKEDGREEGSAEVRAAVEALCEEYETAAQVIRPNYAASLHEAVASDMRRVLADPGSALEAVKREAWDECRQKVEVILGRMAEEGDRYGATPGEASGLTQATRRLKHELRNPYGKEDRDANPGDES